MAIDRFIPKIVTVKWLRSIGMCNHGIARFLRRFPSGRMFINRTNLAQLSGKDLAYIGWSVFIGWSGRHLGSFYREFKKRRPTEGDKAVLIWHIEYAIAESEISRTKRIK